MSAGPFVDKINFIPERRVVSGGCAEEAYQIQSS